jgi:peptidoglycan/LPS O-acetylase OafA/YrhL
MVAKTGLSYYRPDIDGLRAIAVLAGLLFQARVPGFASGFVSVDIFFVISGFLIAGIILRQIQDGKFSFRTFYLRRFRRILPALAVMLIGTVVLSSFVLLPEDFKLLGRHVAATVLMIPNMSIWEASGDYFAPTVDANPLLDLWSLGVEEQFYLLTPLLLLLLIRHVSVRWIKWILAGIWLGSFSLAVWLAGSHPCVGFYWSPPRAWELLCGVGLAYFHFVQQPTTNNQQPTTSKDEWLAFALLIAILASVVIPSSGVGESALVHQSVAVLGTTWLIHLHSFRQTLVSRLLSWKLFVGIGLISYPLYLWRWPLFSLRSYWPSIGVIPWHETLLLLVLCFVLSYLTWRWVEQPARRLPIRPSKSLIKWVVTTQLALLVIGVSLWTSNGLIWRFSPVAIAYLEDEKDINPLRKKCHRDPYLYDASLPVKECIFGNLSLTHPQFIVWGSSHADALVPVFKELANQHALAGIQMSLSSSPALLDVSDGNPTLSRNKNWKNYNQNVLKLIEEKLIKNVFLVARSSSYAYGSTKFEGNVESTLQSSTTTDPRLAFEYGLEKAVATLVAKDKRVWLMLPVPEMDRTVPRWLAFHNAGETEVWVDNPYPERAASLRPFFERLSQQYGVHLLDPLPHLCRADGKCRIAHNGKSVYYDDDHLSASGSLLLADMLRPAFERMKQDK